MEKRREFSKKSLKFLEKVDNDSKNKIYEAIDSKKNMVKLAKVGKNKGDRYRIKLEHFRIILINEKDSWYVDTIDTKTNCKMRKNGYF